jgi:serine protease Do
VVEHDARLDLAILKIDNADTHAADNLQLGKLNELQPGDEVFSLGAPHRMTFSFGHGVVSYVGRAFQGISYIQTDLPINIGNSGGPVLDARGRVIGVSMFILRQSSGLAFALPIERAIARFPHYFAEKEQAPQR